VNISQETCFEVLTLRVKDQYDWLWNSEKNVSTYDVCQRSNHSCSCSAMLLSWNWFVGIISKKFLGKRGLHHGFHHHKTLQQS